MSLISDIYNANDAQRFQSEQHRYIAEIVADYSPDLRLCFIPDSDRLVGQEKWAVLFKPGTPEQYVVLTAKDCDQRILERLWLADTHKHDVLKQIEVAEAAAEALKMRAWLDKHHEAMDVAETIWKSPLHTFKHNGVTYT